MVKRYLPWIVAGLVIATVCGTLAWQLNACRRALVPGGWLL